MSNKNTIEYFFENLKYNGSEMLENLKYNGSETLAKCNITSKISVDFDGGYTPSPENLKPTIIISKKKQFKFMINKLYLDLLYL